MDHAPLSDGYKFPVQGCANKVSAQWAVLVSNRARWPHCSRSEDHFPQVELGWHRRWHSRVYRIVFGLLLCVLAEGVARAATPPGFKDLYLGMSIQTAQKVRQLTCTATGLSTSLPPSTVPESRGLRTQAHNLRSRAWSGDANCLARKPDTVGGMRIAELQLLFAKQTLQRITITIADDGRSQANG